MLLLRVKIGLAFAALLVGVLMPQTAWAAVHYADFVVGYVSGGGAENYDNPGVALGSPERMTGEGVYPGQVEPFNPPWLSSEIVSIGPTGHLTLGFNNPILNDRGDGYDADFIVFGNTFFVADWSTGTPVNTNPAGTYEGPGVIEVSQDNSTWYRIDGIFADSLFPTLGYQDAVSGSDTPGAIKTNFWEPMNSSLSLSDFDGLGFADMVALYGSSGGGAAVDISDAVDGDGNLVNLASISYVRFTVPAGATYTTEIDAVAVVPEPATLALLVLGAGVALRRRRQ